jgi:AbrB family looped-hinge helix DNA binding protein
MYKYSGLVTIKGQVLIPKHIREKYNIKPNSQVVFEEEDGKVILRPAIAVSEAKGMFKHKVTNSFSEKDMELAIEEAALERHSQKK